MRAIVNCKLLCYIADDLADTKEEVWRKFSFDLEYVIAIQESIRESESGSVVYLAQEQFVVDVKYDTLSSMWSKYISEKEVVIGVN